MRRKNTKFSGTATGKKFSKVAWNGQMKLEIVQRQLVSLNRPRTEIVVSSRTEKKTKKIGGKKIVRKVFPAFQDDDDSASFLKWRKFFWQSRLQRKLKRQQPKKQHFSCLANTGRFFPSSWPMCISTDTIPPSAIFPPTSPPHSIKIRN